MYTPKLSNTDIESFNCGYTTRQIVPYKRSFSNMEQGMRLMLSQSTQTVSRTDDMCSKKICPEDNCSKSICTEPYAKPYVDVCRDFSKLKNEIEELCNVIGVNKTLKQHNLKILNVRKHLQEIRLVIDKLESNCDVSNVEECKVKPNRSGIESSTKHSQNWKYNNTVKDTQYSHKDNKGNTLKLWKDLFRLRTFPQKLQALPFTLEQCFQSLANGASSPSSSDGACSTSLECMSNELLRLSSFRTFPRDIDISMTRLAKTGFYQNGQPGETKCYSCGITYRSWKSGDNPLEIHKRLSPECTLVCNNAAAQISTLQNNVSVESNSSEVRNNTGGQNADEINSTPLLSENHVATTTSSITSAALNTSQSRSSYVSSESVTSQSRNSNRTSERSSTEQNPLSTQTNQNNGRPTNEISESASSNQQLSNNGGIETLGINIEKPKYPNYATLQTRMSSYQGWPAYLDQTPRDMAMAGFLFAGYNDYTRCFFCGGGLRNWEAGDDPWVEHARWFPQCAFLKQNKEEKFLQAVLKKHQEVEQETSGSNVASGHTTNPPLLTAARNQQPNHSHNVTTNDLICTIAARSVLEMGYSRERVLYALKKISSSPLGSKDITATEIMKIILNEDTNDLSCQRSAGHVVKKEISENEVVSEVLPELFSDVETKALMEENRQLRDQRVCKVCLDLEATIAFLPCGHIACCSDCAPAMRKCPLCRIFIKGTVKTYLA